ncbi:hypothetical protein Ccrd_009867 [Cynara cardunculus var. scolymus]|uniref:Uncharacterized protein n=1 Tax=Cynara cardunculus var. scolymus TaxID=59895 RepID=A0A124SI62_CYNCS|nr:hypothetical protein Ccrd_009867 [Cynara cardunculus var. scolymus]
MADQSFIIGVTSEYINKLFL